MQRGSAPRGRGGPQRGGRGGSGQSGGERPGLGGGRAPILDLQKFHCAIVRVKFTGGREITGILKGSDALTNLVMDNVEEVLRDPISGQPIEPAKVRQLGLAVIRGTALVVINPIDGFEAIENPFTQ